MSKLEVASLMPLLYVLDKHRAFPIPKSQIPIMKRLKEFMTTSGCKDDVIVSEWCGRFIR